MKEIQGKSILVRVSECVDLGSQLYKLLLNNYWSETYPPTVIDGELKVEEQVHC